MSEVPIILFNSMRRTFERFGVDTAPHVRGLSLAEVPRSAFGGRVDWDELAEFLERCGEELTPEEQERVGELYPLENQFLHYVLRATLSPSLFHRIVWIGTRPAFPHMRIEIDSFSDAHIAVRLELPHHRRGCEMFFRGTAGECATVTELLGLGRSEVTADVGPWHGNYHVRFPVALPEPDDLRTMSARLVGDRRWKMPALVGWLLGYERDIAALTERLHRAHGLERSEAHIVVRLGQGASLMEIAGELGWTGSRLEAHLLSHQARIAAALREEIAAQILRHP